ncbi:MAG: hypothetical protein EXR62_13685 [Chloroflexi bacterium]|nr:hypothetical protein [Chloroflexota bacterium]
MQPNIVDWLVHQERFNDFVREADNERLIRQVHLNRSRWDQQLAVFLGARLLEWGARLRRYGQAAPTPCPEIANSR